MKLSYRAQNSRWVVTLVWLCPYSINLLILLQFYKHCLTCHVAQRSVHPPARPFPVELLQAKTGSPLVWPTQVGEVDSIGDKAKQFIGFGVGQVGYIENHFHRGVTYAGLAKPVVSFLAGRQVALWAHLNLIHLQSAYWVVKSKRKNCTECSYTINIFRQTAVPRARKSWRWPLQLPSVCDYLK